MGVTAAVGRASGATRSFVDRHPWVGPAVFVSSVVYFAAQLVVALAWHPAYSVVNNTISDLGNTACGDYHGAYVCSPRHAVMNAAFVFLGVVMALGSMLLGAEFAERTATARRSSGVGFTLVAVGGLGAVLVGAFPENTVGALHLTGAGLAIGSGNLGILVLGVSLPLPAWLGRPMVAVASLSIVALVLFASGEYLGTGPGAMERIAAYPETVWMIVFGSYTSRSRGAGVVDRSR
jgi:hypothetical membrane protein